MRKRLLLLKTWSDWKRPPESLLQPGSPMHLWLTHRRESPEAATTQDLLGALSDPQAGWPDRVLGYAALGELDLSAEDRAHANRLLCRGLSGSRKDWLTQVGEWTIQIGLLGLWSECLWETPYDGNLTETILIGGAGVLPWLLFLDRRLQEYRRVRIVKRAAAAALAKTGDAECLPALTSQMRWRWSPLQQDGVAAVQAILQTITPESYRRLSSEAEVALLRLVVSPQEEVALGALDALERIGDGRYAAPLASLLRKIKSQRVHARAQAVFSLLPGADPGAAPLALSRPLFSLRLREHPLQRWLARREADQAPGSATALLEALSMPLDNARVRVQGLRALCELDLSPSERTQAGQILAATLPFTGANRALLPRISRAAGLSLFISLGLGAFCGVIRIIFVPWSPHPAMGELLKELADALEDIVVLTGGLTALLALFFFLGLTLVESDELLKVRRTALFSAERIGGPECLPALHEYMTNTSPLRLEALAALRQILPRVTTDWYGRLPVDVTSVLLELADTADANISCLAIEAIGRAGGGNCVDQMARLAQHAFSPVIRRRAAAILPILQERRERESSAATLLRASQPTGSDHLLKPVYAAEPDTTNLLRASSGRGDEEGRS